MKAGDLVGIHGEQGIPRCGVFFGWVGDDPDDDVGCGFDDEGWARILIKGSLLQVHCDWFCAITETERE